MDNEKETPAPASMMQTLKNIESMLFDQKWEFKTFFILALFYTFYFAAGLLVPIFLAFLLYFLMFPVVDFLKNRWHIPRYLGAALVIIFLLIAFGYIFYFISNQSREWLNQGPSLIDAINQKLATVTSMLKRPVEILTRLWGSIADSLHLSVQNIQTSWYSVIFSNTWDFLIEFSMTMIVLYFLLAAKNSFLTKLVKILLHIQRTQKADAVIQQIEQQIWRYLSTRTVINIGVAIVTSIMLWLFQLPNPLLWGVMAGLLEFIPYIGALISLVVILLVSLISFTHIGYSLLPPLAFFIFISLEGNIFAPYILGRSMTMNKVAVVLSILLFGWIWGPVGAFLAVPLIMTVKIILDNINKENVVNLLLEE